MAIPPTLDQMRSRYVRYWSNMKIDQGKVSALDTIARARIAHKDIYQRVEATTGVPWWWIAIIHNRESGGDFGGVLHNGEHIIGTGRKTRLVPAGRGPFNSWDDAAVDALQLKGLHKIRDWSLERVCYEGERFNGFGYYYHGIPSAYLWSFTNIYQGGKYIADGVWDANARDAQAGIMPLLKRMMGIDSSIKFGASTVPPKPPKVTPETGAAGGVVVGGGAAAAEAARQGFSVGTIVAIAVATVVIAVVAFFIIRAVRKKDIP